jgi:hypothetical protein
MRAMTSNGKLCGDQVAGSPMDRLNHCPVLRGKNPEIRTMAVSTGTLNSCRGKSTPQKVNPVKGARTRVIAVFSVFDKPGVRFSDEERIGFYGRAA